MRAIRQHRRLGPTAIVIVVGVVAVMLWQADDLERWLGEDGEAATVDVVRVIDGDTLSVERDGAEERVRILGIDAPEVARDGRPGERCADEATALTEELTADAGVVLVTDQSQSETDRYGRTLAYVEAAGQDISGQLLSAGLAEVYESAPDIRRYATYVDLAEQAGEPDCER